MAAMAFVVTLTRELRSRDVMESTALLAHTGSLWAVATITVGTGGGATRVVSTVGIGMTSHGCDGSRG